MDEALKMIGRELGRFANSMRFIPLKVWSDAMLSSLAWTAIPAGAALGPSCFASHTQALLAIWVALFFSGLWLWLNREEDYERWFTPFQRQVRLNAISDAAEKEALESAKRREERLRPFK